MLTCRLHGSPEGTDGVNPAWSLARVPAGRHRGISGAPLSTYKARLMPPASSARCGTGGDGFTLRLSQEAPCPQPQQRRSRGLLAAGARGGGPLGTAPQPQPQPWLGLSLERGSGSSWSALPSLGRRAALQSPAQPGMAGDSPRGPRQSRDSPREPRAGRGRLGTVPRAPAPHRSRFHTAASSGPSGGAKGGGS